MVYITGDTHRDFERIYMFCDKLQTTKQDVMIILGDAGINYFGGDRDQEFKELLSQLPITLFCIHGNHEIRPGTICTYKTKLWHGGFVFYEDAYPNILFPDDGETFDINGKKCLVIGGAYSVDKFYRLKNGYHWFADEQPSDAIKAKVEAVVKDHDIDVVLSHTCPIKYEPTEVFLPGIDQSTVDKTTEQWLGELESRMDYQLWYCGHYHINKRVDKMRFLFEDICEF